MKGLLHVLKRKPTERKKAVYTCPPDRGVHIVCKVGGFWFWLNHSQWASHLNMNRGTISNRAQAGKPVDQVLGFTKLVRARQTGNSSSSKTRKKRTGANHE